MIVARRKMAITVNPDLLDELKEFGAKDASVCFNCGNCTAVCPLSEEATPFPRKAIRYLQIGAEEHLFKSSEPWLCYYCGECSETCPREANPGETMMGIRRYLTSRYDWTGFSKRFYTSKIFEILAVLIVAALVGIGFYAFHGPIIRDHVALNVFAPNRTIEVLDLILLVVLSTFLLSNAYRMFKAIMGEERKKIPFSLYLRELKEFIVQFATQKRFLGCKSDSQKKQWIIHILIMTGYSIIFLLVVVGIRWFQRDEIYAFYHPIRLLGYYATFAILYGTTYAIIGRIKKSKTVYRFSHSTDWMFLILLWLTTFTGILIHFTRLLNLPLTTYYLYVIHLMIAVPMLILEVPFAKWAHQLYRPFVLYLLKVREKAQETQ